MQWRRDSAMATTVTKLLGVLLCIFQSHGMILPKVASLCRSASTSKWCTTANVQAKAVFAENALSYRRSALRLVSSKSVTGIVYKRDKEYPTVKLFTKEGCTLCDYVKNTLVAIVDDHPHTLMQIDITDEEHVEWFNRYKFDIPVLHMNDIYWTKHRLSVDEAVGAMKEALQGNFSLREGEPNAIKQERRN